MKERYERVRLEVIAFETEDVIMTSVDPDEYESERAMIQIPLL